MPQKLPKHIAIIMDGNGRWAGERGLPRVAGHKAGVQKVREIVQAAVECCIPILTLYAFSQENWKRPKEEVDVLMGLLDYFIEKEIQDLVREGVSLRTIGRTEMLPPKIYEKIQKAIQATSSNKTLILNIALNYGARTEILDAAKCLAEKARQNPSMKLEDIQEEDFAKLLYTAGLPDPDLLIRTSGEMRLSNFLLWQLSYTEIYITKKYWPDFSKADFVEAVQEYSQRERRFGDVVPA